MSTTDRSGASGTRRLAMALVGVVLLVFYVAAASLAYSVIGALWALRPDPATLVLAVGVGTLAAASLSYRVGTVRLLSQLDAVPLTRERAPRLHDRLDRLVDAMDTERPELRVGDLPSPTALSLEAGESGVVVLDAELLRAVSLDEAEAILAHELAHLEGRDVFVQTLAYTALRTVVGFVLFALLPVTLLVTGLAQALAWTRGRPGSWAENPVGKLRIRLAQAVMVVFAVVTIAVRAHSRRREYAADERAAAVTGNPMALASALRTIERRARRSQGLLSQLTIGGSEDDLTRLFSTHPSTADRVDRLRTIAERREASRWTTIPVE